MDRRKSSLWLKSFLQPVTYLGGAMAIVVIAAMFHLVHKDRSDNYATAVRNGDNLVRLFEGYISRSVKGVDASIKFLRNSYIKNIEAFDIEAWAGDFYIANDLTLQLTIVGPDGRIVSSTFGPSLPGIFVGDREHILTHVDSASDSLFISKPVLLRTQNRWSVILSRRITLPDGSFGGVISAAIDPVELEKFYRSLDLGQGGIASLVGFDGAIRARGGRDESSPDALGRSIGSAPVFKRYVTEPTGRYWNNPGTVDSTKRLMSYRVVDGFPLIALVGLSEAEIFKNADQNARLYYAIGCILLLGIFTAVGFGAARKRKLLTMTSSLERTNARFATALAHMPHGLCMYDEDQRLTVCNELYGKMYGLAPEMTQPGTPFTAILDATVVAGNTLDQPEVYAAKLRDAEARRSPADYVLNNRKTGTSFLVNRRPLPDGGWLAIHQDVTAQKRAEAEIRHLAHYDGLTSLANRVRFLDRVNTAAKTSSQLGTRFAVHLLDLDRFKEVNDTLGHVFGDKLLKSVAERLVGVAGQSDLVARLGGDEFAILQKLDPGDRQGAGDLARRILALFDRPFEIEGQQISVETSIGIALLPEHGIEAEGLLKNADLALYRAKSEGRNTCRLFEFDMERAAQERRATEIDLRNALARDEFEIYYQLLVDVTSGDTVGVEALVRWRHPERGLVPPDQFIGIAEDTGLICQVGEWVISQACRDAAKWPEHLKLAVNLSPAQFKRRDLIDIVTNALQSSGLWPGRLELEITETVLLQDDEENLALLHQLRSLGISIVLDDFGTGYSSLGYLQRFPFDKIKIDRSFVANLTTRPDCAAIVCAVTGLARSLDIMTTAEGVETEEQLRLLRAAGCTHAQGFLFGRPVPKSELMLDVRIEDEIEAA